MRALKRIFEAPASADRRGDRTPGVHAPGVHASGVHASGVHTSGVHASGVHTSGVTAPGVASPGIATPAGEYERARRLDSENAKLRELVKHCAAHSAYGNCGYDQMNAEQRLLYDGVVGRAAPAGAPRVMGVGAPNTPWRSCEFCGCRTNAAERVCCGRGRDTDRRNWQSPEA